jgi:predicted AAA+ superfamily ATPase
MYEFTKEDVRARLEGDNPWWSPDAPNVPEAEFLRRTYFAPFQRLAANFDIRRAVILLGPRRVGKTVMLMQLIHDSIVAGFDRKNILYARIDAPIYSGMPLEKYLEFLPKKPNGSDERYLICFDEIQYLPNWEVHLKDLVDRFPRVKFVASGSAAAALRLRSKESGAGRFTDFMLPPLTFHEFLLFINRDDLMYHDSAHAFGHFFMSHDIAALNELFVDYLNYGGYPEAVLNEEIRRKADQFVRNDIIEKVLLKDLPSLYGIDNIQDLNRLFAVLAYNTGNEVSLEAISQNGGPSKPTIKKYIEYLESAFLIIKLLRVDENCKSFSIERNFKIYLNNPSMRAALFAPVKSDETEKIGHLTESAIFSQWQHGGSLRDIRYARWKNQGEVDIVQLDSGTQKPLWIGEIKWSDRIGHSPAAQHDETESMRTILENHPKIENAFITSRTIYDVIEVAGRKTAVIPSAAYCYTVGRNITEFIRDNAAGIPERTPVVVVEPDL